MACSFSCLSFFRGFDLYLFWNISFASIMSSHLLYLTSIQNLGNAKVKSNKIGSRHQKVKMKFIISVETDRLWCTLRS